MFERTMETISQSSDATRKVTRVIIIGGGFGGLYAAKGLAGQPVQVTLIDRTNHHLFQPLLYQVATAGLSPGDIAQPIRHILRDAQNINVLMENVEAGVLSVGLGIFYLCKRCSTDLWIFFKGFAGFSEIGGSRPAEVERGCVREPALELTLGRSSDPFMAVPRGSS
jgi:hypothetical protein